MSINRSLAAKALLVAQLAYDKSDPAFRTEHDDFYVEIDDEERIVWIGVAGSNDRYDWFDNFLASRGWFDGIVKAHKRWFKRAKGFKFRLDKIVDKNAGYRVMLSGHSYGGAAASNYAFLRRDRVTECFTWNSPKPWAEFKDGAIELQMREMCHHFINDADKITRTPFRNRCFGREYRKDINRFGQDHTNWEALHDIVDWYL